MNAKFKLPTGLLILTLLLLGSVSIILSTGTHRPPPALAAHLTKDHVTQLQFQPAETARPYLSFFEVAVPLDFIGDETNPVIANSAAPLGIGNPRAPEADPIFHAETDLGISPYWGRQSYPNYDLHFTMEMTYPYPYTVLGGDPVPVGTYVHQCTHDEAAHMVRCTGTFPKGTPGGDRAQFNFRALGTCALFPNPPASITYDYHIFWSDGPHNHYPVGYAVAPVPNMTMINPAPADGALDVFIVDQNGLAPVLQWDPPQPLACGLFPMPDIYDTYYKVALRQAGENWPASGWFNCTRQFPLQPEQLPCAENGEPVTWEWRIEAYDYKYGRCRAVEPVKTVFKFTAGSCRPEITVQPEFGNAYFLNNVAVANNYRVEVDWSGSAFAQPAQPPFGNVLFILNGQETVLAGQSWGAEHSINMGSGLQADWSGGNNLLEIYATYDGGTGQQVQSEHYTAQPLVFPYPEWAGTLNAGPFSAGLGEGVVTYANELNYPEEPFEANVGVPKWVPYLGGKEIGILETQAGAKITASSKGTGKLGVEGQTGLGLGIDIIGAVNGDGEFTFGVGDGLKLNKSSFGLSIAARFQKVVTLGDLVPALRAMEDWWIIGKGVKKLNNLAQITGTLTPKIGITAFFHQEGRETWVFTGSVGRGEIAATIRGDLKLLEKLYAWAEGGGTPFIELNFPPAPGYLRELGIDLFFKAGFRAWFYEAEFARAITCALPQAGCYTKEDDGMRTLVGGTGWSLMARDYITQAYHIFLGQDPARSALGSQTSTAQAILVSNVYPLSEPALAVRSDDHRTLVYIHDDPAKPLGQGLELLATQWDGTIWSPPLALTDDQHLDFAPQLVYDGIGNAVAIWERSHTDAITTGLTITFMQSLGIGTTTWFSATQSWGAPTMLSQTGQQAHFAPRLRTGSDGTVLAMWETNDGGDLFGTLEHPLTYTYALWDGTDWSAPLGALHGLTNTFGMDVAIFCATQAALVSVGSTDALSPTQGLELFYSLYDGAGWSPLQRLTNDQVPDTSPRLIYDAAGQIKLLWLRGTELVMLDGSWDVADLQVVRGDSGEFGFLAPMLARSPQGHLALAWQSGHAGLFDLAYSIYDAEAQRWGVDQYLTQDDALELAVSPAFGADGKLFMAYVKQQTEYFTTTVVFSPTLTVTYTNIPHAGASDLALLEHVVGRDLSLSDLRMEPRYPAPGTPVTVTVSVHNSGDLTTGPIVIRFEDESIPWATMTVAADLTAGTSITATTTYTAPGFRSGSTPATGPRTLRAVVDPDDDIVELDESNNTAELTAFEARLIAEWAELRLAGGPVAVLSVVNAGTSPASAPITAALREGNPLTGTIIATGTWDTDVAVGAHAVITLPVAMSQLQVVATAAAPQTENSLGWMIAGNPAPDLANAWPVDLRGLPDLTLRPADIALSGFGSLALLPKGNFTTTLHNTGAISASNVLLTVRANSFTGGLVYSQTIPFIAPQAATVVAFDLPTATLPATLWFQLDPENTIIERDETNNVAVALLDFTAPVPPGYRLYLPLLLR